VLFPVRFKGADTANDFRIQEAADCQRFNNDSKSAITVGKSRTHLGRIGAELFAYIIKSMRFEMSPSSGVFHELFENGILRRALAEGLVTVGVHDLRAFTHDRHRTVDDRPFGGGEAWC